MKIQVHQPKNEYEKATKIALLLAKRKSLMTRFGGGKQTLIPIKQPGLILLREDHHADIYENAKAGEFEFQGTDGKDKTIHLDQSSIYTMSYGQDTAKIYVCDERLPFPLPQKPILYAELFRIAIDKIANDYKQWKAKEIQAKANLIWYALGGLALIILAFGLYKMFTAQPPTPQQAQGAIQAGTTIVRNATIL